MFNKGKPYVPPPTRAMGSAHAHDDLHSIEDELELNSEIQEDQTLASGTARSDSQAFVSPLITPTQTNVVIEHETVVQASPETEDPTDSSNAGYRAAESGGTGGWSGDNRTNTPSRPAREASSVLGNGMTFEGDISGVGQLVIEGTVKGDVRVSHVLINQNGSVEGTVHADNLEVRGKVTGAIIAKQVHLHASSRVEGDITQEQLTVDRGAWFSGRSTQAKRAEESEAAPSAEITPAAE